MSSQHSAFSPEAVMSRIFPSDIRTSPPEPLRSRARIVEANVLYRSLLGFARPVASSQKPVSGQQQEAEKAGPGAQSMSVNACLQLSAYSLGANLSSISHSQLELQLPEQPLKPAAHARWLPSPQQECWKSAVLPQKSRLGGFESRLNEWLGL